MAALLGIHGKSRSAARTPANKASTLKKIQKQEAKSGPRSALKARRPLFSEILKKAVNTANAPPKTKKVSVPTNKKLFAGVAKKKAAEKQQLSALAKVR